MSENAVRYLKLALTSHKSVTDTCNVNLVRLLKCLRHNTLISTKQAQKTNRLGDLAPSSVTVGFR
uniref:Uncharacterized protein n=1 Tax=Anguilla anguilla TaxID=7936 RepID=A0A0E9RRQ5_ANGAN